MIPKQSRTIGVRELKAHASAVLHEVANDGAEFIITVHGRPVARIEPIAGTAASGALDGTGGTRGILAGFPVADAEDFEAVKRLWDPRPFDTA